MGTYVCPYLGWGIWSPEMWLVHVHVCSMVDKVNLLDFVCFWKLECPNSATVDTLRCFLFQNSCEDVRSNL